MTPDEISSASVEEMRASGLSVSKSKCIRDIACRVKYGRLDFERLETLSNEEAAEELTKISCIGRWTAEMFLIFGLKRLDVLSTGDAGLRRSAKLLHGEESDLEKLGEKWRPYRSVASWYLWRNLDRANG